MPIAVPLAYALAPNVRRAARLNAARVFGAPIDPTAPQAVSRPARYGEAVLKSFYRFSLGVASGARLGRQALLARVRAMHGREQYARLRARRSDQDSSANAGVVLVTGHIGSFEVGLAALAAVEPGVHVVFMRDASTVFERQRSALRHALGVREVPIDDGLVAWGQLREALQSGGAVVMQGDRAVPGQRHMVVPFLGGHLRVPTGPARLAQLTGSPLVACFALPVQHGVEVMLSDPIDVQALGVEGATRAITREIERVVAARPECWLLLEPTFAEDQAGGVERERERGAEGVKVRGRGLAVQEQRHG